MVEKLQIQFAKVSHELEKVYFSLINGCHYHFYDDSRDISVMSVNICFAMIEWCTCWFPRNTLLSLLKAKTVKCLEVSKQRSQFNYSNFLRLYVAKSKVSLRRLK